MGTFAILATVLAAGSAVFAAPAAHADKRENNFGGVVGPLGGLLGGSPAAGVGGSAQAAEANLFKFLDESLNIPGDAIGEILKGNPIGAGTGLLQDIVKAGSDIPKDAMALITPLINSGKKSN